MAYDEKYRIRAVEYRKEGHTIEQTAKVFKISTTTVKDWTKKYDDTGEIKDKPLKRTFKKIDPVKLESYMEEHPDAYLLEIAKAFSCSDAAVVKALKRLGITRKKR
jgi:transposase